MSTLSNAQAEEMLMPGWVITEGDLFTEFHRPDFAGFRIFSLGLVAPFDASNETAHIETFEAMKAQWNKSPRCDGLNTSETIKHRGGLLEARTSPDRPKCRIMGLNLAPSGFFGVIIWHPDGLSEEDSAFAATTNAAITALWDAGYQSSGQSGPHRGDSLELSDPMNRRESPEDFLIVRMKVDNNVIYRALPIFAGGLTFTCSQWDPSFLDRDSQLLSNADNCISIGVKGDPKNISIGIQEGKNLNWGPAITQLEKIFPGREGRKLIIEDARIGVAKPFTKRTVDFQTEGADMTPYLSDVNFSGPAGSRQYGLSFGQLILTKSGKFASGTFSALSHTRHDKSKKVRGRYKFNKFHVRTELSTGEKHIGFAAWWDDDPTKTEPDDRSHILMFGTVFKPCFLVWSMDEGIRECA